MATRHPTAPARAGERSRALIGVYARPAPLLTPDEAAPGTPEPWHLVAPVRPDTAHVRAPRVLDLAADLVSALLIIAGGLLAYGHAHLA